MISTSIDGDDGGSGSGGSDDNVDEAHKGRDELKVGHPVDKPIWKTLSCG